MVGVLRTLQINRGDVCEISSTRLLIDRTRIHLQVHIFRQVGGDQNDGQRLKEDLWFRFSESSAATVPPRPLQEEAEHVDALRRGVDDVVLEAAGDLVVKHNHVEGPSLVGAGHLLMTYKQHVKYSNSSERIKQLQ